MFRVLRRNLTPGTVIAFVALVFALTGGAFAATGGGGGGGSHAVVSATWLRRSTSLPRGGPRGQGCDWRCGCGRCDLVRLVRRGLRAPRAKTAGPARTAVLVRMGRPARTGNL